MACHQSLVSPGVPTAVEEKPRNCFPKEGAVDGPSLCELRGSAFSKAPDRRSSKSRFAVRLVHRQILYRLGLQIIQVLKA